MGREEAINVLIASAVCCAVGLNCEDHCPFYSNDQSKCNKWDDIKVEKAVKVLRTLPEPYKAE